MKRGKDACLWKVSPWRPRQTASPCLGTSQRPQAPPPFFNKLPSLHVTVKSQQVEKHFTLFILLLSIRFPRQNAALTEPSEGVAPSPRQKNKDDSRVFSHATQI